VKRAAGLLTAILMALASGSAQAHSPIAGVGHFYSGMLHPLLVPAHLIALVAIGLWLEQQRPAGAQALVAMVLAVPAGMLLGFLTGWQRAELAILAVAASLAVAVGMARTVPKVWSTTVGAVLGGLLGVDSLPDGLSGRALWMSLAGTWLAVLLGPAWVMTLCELAVRPWMKIGLRVVGSWMAAAAILVLALNAFGPGARPAAMAVSAPPSATAR
jgi:hydrogenase/urease accessory protein HupE